MQQFAVDDTGTERFAGAEAATGGRAFLVATEGQRLAVHTMQGVGNPREQASLVDAIAVETGRPARHRRHRVAEMQRAESLEALLKGLRCGTILHDPTGIFTRAQSLVAFAHSLRDRAAGRIAGIYWSGEWRTVFVRLDPAAFVSGEKVDIVRLGETEREIYRAFAETCGEDALSWIEAVRISLQGLPVGVTAIDAKSERPGSKVARRIGKGLAASVLGAALGMSATAQAQQSKPAVSGVNGSLSIMGGGFRSDDLGASGGGITALNADGGAKGAAIAIGSISAPIGERFGVQLDAGGGIASGDPAFGGTLHVFWRDPDVALAGLVGSYAHTEQDVFVSIGGGNFARQSQDINIGRIGGETEIYLDRFSILARAGYQFGDGEEDFYGRLNVAYYPWDDLMIAAGPEYFPGAGVAGSFEIEWLDTFSESIGLSYFVDAAIHDSDNYHAFAGIRLYFGDNKSLIRRHREDDPRPDDFITGIANGTQATSYFYSGFGYF